MRQNFLLGIDLCWTKHINTPCPEEWAGVAQLVEQLICNQQVGGSNPSASLNRRARGGVPEWPKGVDCKSTGAAFGGSNPPPSTRSGNSSGGRASAFQAEGRGFESRFPLHFFIYVGFYVGFCPCSSVR